MMQSNCQSAGPEYNPSDLGRLLGTIDDVGRLGKFTTVSDISRSKASGQEIVDVVKDVLKQKHLEAYIYGCDKAHKVNGREVRSASYHLCDASSARQFFFEVIGNTRGGGNLEAKIYVQVDGRYYTSVVFTNIPIPEPYEVRQAQIEVEQALITRQSELEPDEE